MRRPNRLLGALLVLAGVLAIAASTNRQVRPHRTYVLWYETLEPADRSTDSPIEPVEAR